MKKFYFLGLAMLFGVVNIGHAQVQIGTPLKLVEAKDSLNKIITYNETISEKDGYIKSYQMDLDKTPKKTTTPERTENVPYGTEELDKINNFVNNFGSETDLKLYVDISTGSIKTLSVWTVKEDAPADAIEIGTNIPEDGYDIVPQDITVRGIAIYYKRNGKSIAYTSSQTLSSSKDNNINT